MPSLAQRLAFPSATGPLGRNRDRRVSALSIYSDIVWDYSEETGRIKDSRINWGAELSSGSALITYPGFCEPMKDYVDAHASGRVVKTRKLKTGSLKMWVYTMFSVVDFHVQRGKHSFVELLPSDHDAYLLHLRSRTVSAGSVNRLFAAKAFWQSDEELGLNMADFGPKPPYINSSPYALLHIKNYGRKAKMQTEVIPDDVLWPLFNVCVEYVEKLSPYILALKRRLDAAEAEYAKYPLVPGGYRPTAPKRLQALFRGIRDLKSGARIRSREVPGFGKVEIKQQAFDDFVKGVARPNPRETTLLPNGVSNLGELRAEIRHLETACYILLGLVTGMRHSELDSVEENGLEETASVAGNKILWVHGVLRKTSKKDKGIKTKWVCGQYGVMAVTIAAALTEFQRKKHRTKHLFIHTGFTFRNEPAQRKRSGDHGLRTFKYFPAFMARIGIRRANGQEWYLHAHQLRRTFIRMIVRVGDISIHALQLHCKHLNYHMTEYYVGTNLELWLEFQEANDVMKKRVLADILGSEELAGIGGRRQVKDINEAIESGKLPKNFRGLAGDGIRLKIAETLLRGGKRVNFHTTNICDISNSSESKCSKDGKPVFHLCQPTKCTNAKIGPMHAPIWRVILDTAKSGLADPTVRNSAILRAPLLEQKKEAQKVLADLGQPCA